MGREEAKRKHSKSLAPSVCPEFVTRVMTMVRFEGIFCVEGKKSAVVIDCYTKKNAEELCGRSVNCRLARIVGCCDEASDFGRRVSCLHRAHKTAHCHKHHAALRRKECKMLFSE